MMRLQWKSRLFVLLAAGVLACGMAGYSVKAAETSGGTGTETTTPGDSETTEKIDISGDNFSISFVEDKEYTYTGSAITPEVEVVETITPDSGDETQTPGTNNGRTGDTSDTTKTWVKDVNYTLTYDNNINAGTAEKPATVTITPKDTEKYTGEVTLTFVINPKDITDLQMEGKDKVYRGSPINADVNMYYNDLKLERGKDYRVKDYVNNENVGTASATVKGIGNYTGERTMTFEISAKNIYDLPYTPNLSDKTYTYTGKTLTPKVEFTFTVTGKQNAVLGKRILTEGTDYTISYVDNKKVGVANVMVIGKGNFTGSRIMSFKIRPQETKLKKLVKGKKQIKAKWAEKEKQVTGYVVMCSTKKDFSSNVKKVKVKKGTKKYTFKNLKSKKKYFVRVRTYKKAAGMTYYSEWSNVLKIKTR
ncbi:fibronectin type III domain-containing protein [Eubacterium sp. An3]|uniref:fibronectin type III domain-containing protein n=1 Tax=Eubacterium sp. An3 TaxID=1965628 RepID=UPI001302DAB9|nr:fibronectin type III domain-containing protein [Eubacterium sp. An3]